MVSNENIARELRRATKFNLISVTGAGLICAVLAAIALVFVFAGAEEKRDLRAWEDRLGIVAETRAGVMTDWVERQYRELGALAENASLQLYMTELAASGARNPQTGGVQTNDGQASITAELAEAGYLRNLLTVVADRAGFLSAETGPDVDANVERIAVSGMALVDTAGNILAATRGMPPLRGTAYETLISANTDTRRFVDIRRTAGGVLVAGFSMPVYAVHQETGTARPLGHVVGIRRVEDAVRAALKQPGFSWETAEIYLVRQRANQVEYLTARRNGPDPLTGARDIADDGLIAAISVRGDRAFGTADDYAGQRSLFAARPVANAPWHVVTKVSRAEALGGMTARRNLMVAGLLTGIALIVAAFVAVWRHGTSVRARTAAERYRDMAQRYEAQSQFLRLVADSQPNPMFIVDEDSRFRFANRAAADQAETTDADMMGKSISSVLGPAEARRYEMTNDDALSTGEIVSLIHRSGSNGDLRVIQAEHIPVAEGPDFENGVLVVEQDITGAVSEREHREAALKQLVRTLLTVVDSRDPYAANHSAQVAVVARAIAEEMSLDEELIDTAETAGSLMNVGKLLVPVDLLTKPGELLDGERQQVRDSIASGAALLNDVPFGGPVVETLRQMTEKWDGSGHPAGVAGADILVTARVVAVANAFVAMLNPRAWRPGADFDHAIESLLASAGQAFDRAVVAALINRLENHGGRAEWASLPTVTPTA